MNKKIILAIAAGGILVGSIVLVFSQQRNLGGSFVAAPCFRAGAVATTSLSHMTFGTATTTLTCEVKNVDSISLYALLVASSTNTRFGYRVERSINNIDWFAEANPVQELATTTALTGSFADYSISFASSTAGTSSFVSGSPVSTSTNLVHIKIPTLGADYIRFPFYLTNSAAGGAGAVWLMGVRKESFYR